MKSKNLSEKILRSVKSKGFKYIQLPSVIETNHIVQRSGENFRKLIFSFVDQNGRAGPTWVACGPILSTARSRLFGHRHNPQKGRYQLLIDEDGNGRSSLRQLCVRTAVHNAGTEQGDRLRKTTHWVVDASCRSTRDYHVVIMCDVRVAAHHL